MRLFSIIVPVYNVEKYLNSCIDSLIKQSYVNIEIILVDDGSMDMSPCICDEYAKKDDRIVVIHKSNGGLSDARNTGLLRANGEYVLFVDSDDTIALDTIARFAKFSNLKYDIIVGNGTVIGGVSCFTHIEKCGEYTGKEFLKQSLIENVMPMAAVLNMYKREFLIGNNLLFKVGILHEDENFTPRCFLKAETIYNSGIVFYNYYIHSGSITQKRDLSKNAHDLYETCRELIELYEKIEDKYLKKLLFDSLVEKYLNIFQVGKIYQYGKDYIHKRFVIKYSYRLKTKLKAILFCLNCKFYYKINLFFKSLRRRK